MTNYRICKNKYDSYKIQKWNPPFKIFGITVKDGKWVELNKYGITVCKTREFAEAGIRSLIHYDDLFKEMKDEYNKKFHDSWVCDE